MAAAPGNVARTRTQGDAANPAHARWRHDLGRKAQTPAKHRHRHVPARYRQRRQLETGRIARPRESHWRQARGPAEKPDHRAGNTRKQLGRGRSATQTPRYRNRGRHRRTDRNDADQCADHPRKTIPNPRGGDARRVRHRERLKGRCESTRNSGQHAEQGRAISSPPKPVRRQQQNGGRSRGGTKGGNPRVPNRPPKPGTKRFNRHEHAPLPTASHTSRPPWTSVETTTKSRDTIREEHGRTLARTGLQTTGIDQYLAANAAISSRKALNDLSTIAESGWTGLVFDSNDREPHSRMETALQDALEYARQKSRTNGNNDDEPGSDNPERAERPISVRGQGQPVGGLKPNVQERSTPTPTRPRTDTR